MRTLLRALIIAACVLGSAPARAQEQRVVVGAPAGVLTQLLRHLSAAFESQTGIGVSIAQTGADPAAAASMDALLVPSRTSPDAVDQREVFFGEGVLVGSRADRARVLGLRDIKRAFQWIASARGLYVSSSPSLGLRDLELRLWDEVGVNVRVRSTWYVEVAGDEAAVFNQAAQLGAYALIHRATWVSQENRRGLMVLVENDPLLKTAYVSALVRPHSAPARAWHDWLLSESGQGAISAWSLNGVQVFRPANAAGHAGGSSGGNPCSFPDLAPALAGVRRQPR
jgi:tungstate transport system substrate-binding protein